jgi:hypothetical protein
MNAQIPFPSEQVIYNISSIQGGWKQPSRLGQWPVQRWNGFPTFRKLSLSSSPTSSNGGERGAVTVSETLEIHSALIRLTADNTSLNKSLSRFLVRNTTGSSERKGILGTECKGHISVNMEPYVVQFWNRLPADALGTLSCAPSNFRRKVRKVINEKWRSGGNRKNAVKWSEDVNVT